MFYMLAPGGEYYNYSGCGNTVNCNHPLVRQFLLDCLRFWVSEYHVDGFRYLPCAAEHAGPTAVRAHSRDICIDMCVYSTGNVHLRLAALTG